jgi:hypothetical protein
MDGWRSGGDERVLTALPELLDIVKDPEELKIIDKITCPSCDLFRRKTLNLISQCEYYWYY